MYSLMELDLKALHDEMLKTKPSGASHDAELCTFCAVGDDGSNHSPGGEMTTFTQEDIDAAVAQVRSELEAQIAELTVARQTEEAEARFAAEREELEAQIAALQADRDSIALRADQAEKDYSDLVAFLEATQAETAAAAALAEARTERLEKVGSYNFAEDYVSANADRCAGMSEEDFAALTADWDAVLEKREEARKEGSGALPDATAMTASKEEIDSKAAMAEVMTMKFQGRAFDPRSL